VSGNQFQLSYCTSSFGAQQGKAETTEIAAPA
jgi:hypothetical protein